MRQWMMAAVVALTTMVQANAQKVTNNGYPYSQVPFTAVKIASGSFWGDRIAAAREVTVPLAFSKCESEGRYANFVKAAHPSSEYDVGSFMGFSFDDTDVYKTIEGASFILQTYPDKKLEQYIDSVLDVVAAAQEPDGYLYTARTINPQKPHPWAGDRRWVKEEVLSHELYNLGHMVEAACAHYQATGSTKFLDIARRYADCVVREVGPNPGQACVVPGHQIAEMALAKLYLLTGERKYLDEAKFFLDYRGKTEIHDMYTQSDKPVLEQTEAWGHAVRAGYMYAGMADVAALTGNQRYIDAIDAIWQNIVSKKYYITGGVGARHEGEAFGADYELPNKTAYNETCAAIAQVYLNHRMFLLHGDSKYIDCLERTLYNGLISGMSVDGGRFFYPNPLESDGQYKFNADGTTTRQPWFGCACCPSNLSRFIPSLPGYLYAVKDRDLYVNLFAANTATIQIGGKDVEIEEKTNYPWDADISLKVKKNKAGRFRLMLRIPGWVKGHPVPSDLYTYTNDIDQGYYFRVNGQKVEAQEEHGYLVIDRKWKKGDEVMIRYNMNPRIVVANEKVVDDARLFAVERGPLVYCAEKPDNKGIDLSLATRDDISQIKVQPNYTIVNTEGDGQPFRVTAINLPVEVRIPALDSSERLSQRTDLTLIPYYAWNHRGACQMRVWFKR